MLRHASAGRTFLGVIAPGFVFMMLLAGYTSALPLQYLPDIPGYVPVYIRYGDQPLQEINPSLAEAFLESSITLKNVQRIRLHEPVHQINKELTDENSVSLDLKEDNVVQENVKPQTQGNQLIYILPQENINFSQQLNSTENGSILLKLSKSSPSKKTNLKKIKETDSKEETAAN